MNSPNTEELLNYALTLLELTKEELVEKYSYSLVKIVDDDILNAKEQVIAHICNCVSKNAQGVAKAIFDKWPTTNVYKKRETPSKPGTIAHKTRGGKKYVFNMFCQLKPGKPNTVNDSLSQRLLWFGECMEKLFKTKGLKSVAFPYGMGAGLAAGKKRGIDESVWKSYWSIIQKFAYRFSNVKVIVYRKQRFSNALLKLQNKMIDFTLSEKNSIDVYPFYESVSDEEFLEFLKEYIEKTVYENGVHLFYEKYEETHTLKKIENGKYCYESGSENDEYVNKNFILESSTDLGDECVKNIYVYTIVRSYDGNNPFEEELDYKTMNLYDYTKTKAITSIKFRDGWKDFFNSVDDVLHEISDKLKDEAQHYTIFPVLYKVYTPFKLCAPNEIKAVLLGQDPYHSHSKQAMGLCFSVPPDTPPPPSLKNVYIELENNGYRCNKKSGDLVSWAKEGVFMINTSLTVREKEPASHSKDGVWNYFTERLIGYINNNCSFVVFMLWGGYAKKYSRYINTSRHAIVESAHPSTINTKGGFIDSKPFIRVNEALKNKGIKEIDWNLV